MTLAFSFPFVGSKREHFQDWIEFLPEKCDRVYEPFAGSAVFSFQIQRHYGNFKIPLFWAEQDAGMRAIWEAWRSDGCANPVVEGAIEVWKDELLTAHLQTLEVISGLSSRLILGGKTEYWVDGKKKIVRWTGADLVLRLLLRIVRDRLKTILNNHAAYSVCEVAAAYAVFKRFGHGSVMRTNNQGGLNVSLSVDKCKPATVSRWELTYPAFGKPNLSIAPSAAELKYRQNKNWSNGDIALLDPPYFCDRTLYRVITACYPSHFPHAPETMALCVDALRAALKAKVGTIVVTNYYCPALDEAIALLCWQYGRKVEISDRVSLKKLVAGQGNASSGKRTVKDKKPEPIEWVWIIRSNFQQLTLTA